MLPELFLRMPSRTASKENLAAAQFTDPGCGYIQIPTNLQENPLNQMVKVFLSKNKSFGLSNKKSGSKCSGESLATNVTSTRTANSCAALATGPIFPHKRRTRGPQDGNQKLMNPWLINHPGFILEGIPITVRESIHLFTSRLIRAEPS